ncbi:MAG: PID-CTERM protein-sorting domain-containing protein [Salibacteraceae bacterium]
MTNNIVLKAFRTLQVLIFVLIPSVMFAPPIPPNPGSSSAVTPIDGGVFFLFVAGILFGVYQIFQLRKKHVI